MVLPLLPRPTLRRRRAPSPALEGRRRSDWALQAHVPWQVPPRRDSLYRAGRGGDVARDQADAESLGLRSDDERPESVPGGAGRQGRERRRGRVRCEERACNERGRRLTTTIAYMFARERFHESGGSMHVSHPFTALLRYHSAMSAHSRAGAPGLRCWSSSERAKLVSAAQGRMRREHALYCHSPVINAPPAMKAS